MNVLGIIFSNMHDYMVSALTAHRCMGSIPVGGRYRIIDFVLSGFANAGIEQVGVITKSNYQSLMDHLGHGREWDLSRKRGGLSILPPFGGTASGGMYRGRVEALSGIMGYVEASPAEYVICADCDVVANMDYRAFIDNHMETGADISVAYKRMVVEGESRKDVCTFILGRDNRVIDMLIHPDISGEQNVYINVMILSKKLLKAIVSDCNAHNLTSFNKDVLQKGTGRYHINAYEFDGHLCRVDGLMSYYQANLSLLDPDVRAALFPRERPIYTKVRDDAPVCYGLDANVSNSLIADGCFIEGEVENSVLFRGVTVAKGAKVRDCVLMQNTCVGENSSLEYVITDKNVDVKDERNITGFSTYPIYIVKGATV